MDEVVVACGGTVPPRRRRGKLLRLDASPDAEPSEQIQIKIERLIRQLADDPPPAVADLLEVAAYVYVADRLVRRETPQMSGMGEHWRRRFRFVIPVRRPELWSNPTVSGALVNTLRFLSEDEFEFVFEKSTETRHLQPYLGFDQPEARSFDPDDVMLFSGGLDSLAGAANELFAAGRKLLLVTHQSSTAIANRQNALASALATRAPDSVQYVPVWVRKGEQEPIEHTQRLRSFLFAALGITIARLFNRKRLLISENGITSFNLPLAEHVLGTRASRTTHPRVLRDMGQLASLVLGEPFTIENPLLWSTKGEAIASLPANQCADLIRLTTSCASVRFLSMAGRQCGTCSQCVERRLSLLGAGLADREPADSYAIDLFEGPYGTGHDIAMAAHHVLRARRLAAMSESDFASAYGQIFRALSSLPGPRSENIRRVHDLHRRYGAAIVNVVNDRLKGAANLDDAIAAPPRSLLPIITSSAVNPGNYRDPAQAEEPVALQEKGHARPVARRQIILAIDRPNKRILLDRDISVGGKCFHIVLALAERQERDLANNHKKTEVSFFASRKLAEQLEVTEQALRQLVMRVRRTLRTRYFAATGFELDDEDVVESQKWRGYRLNPYVLRVEPAQLRVAD